MREGNFSFKISSYMCGSSYPSSLYHWFGLVFFGVKHTKDNPRKSGDLFPVGSFWLWIGQYTGRQSPALFRCTAFFNVHIGHIAYGTDDLTSPPKDGALYHTCISALQPKYKESSDGNWTGDQGYVKISMVQHTHSCYHQFSRLC